MKQLEEYANLRLSYGAAMKTSAESLKRELNFRICSNVDTIYATDYPMEAWKLLSLNVLPYFQIVTLTPEMYRETIQECADRG